MHFDTERFEYEGFDDHGVHMITEDMTYTVVFILRDGFTAISTLSHMENEDVTLHHHKLEDVMDASE